MPKREGGEFLGHTVVNGRVRFWSVSSLEKGDPRSGGCPRRWGYKYVLGRKEPQSDHAAAGDRLHDELKRYERGELRRDQLSADVTAGLHIVPEPGPDLLAEVPLHRSREVVKGAPWVIDWAPLTAAGIPVIGFMDLQHARGTNKGTEDITTAYDPPGTVEVIDWKRKGSAKANDYILEPSQLLQTIQMSGYGVHVSRAWRGIESIRLSHGYFVCPPGKVPKARKVSLRIVPEQAIRAWEYAEGVARTLVDVAAERDIHRVPANLEACDRYGGCPHRGECRAARTAHLSDALGGSAALSIVQEVTMGLVSNALGGAPLPVATAQPPQPQAPAAPSYAPQAPAPQQAMYAPPGYAPPQGVQPAGYSGSPAPIAPQPAPSAPAPIAPPAPQYQAPAPVAQVDMRAQLEAEERALAAQAASSNDVPADFAQAVKVIEMSGRGFPMLTGRAAQFRAKLFGMMLPPGGALSGGGELAQRITQGIEDPAFIIQLARDLAPQQQAPAPQAPQPPVYAAPAPMQAPAPVQPIQPGPGPYAGVVQNSILPPGAPASNPALAVVQAPAPQAEAPKKRRSRKPASDAAPAAPPVAAAPPAASAAHGYPQPGAGQIPATAAGAADDLEIFVDCLPLGDYQSLRGYVDYVCATLAAKYCVDATGQRGLQDIRIAPKDSPLGFGGWRGVLAATVRECPPQPGTYYLDTRGSDVNEVVAEALATVCESRGHLYVRSVR